MIEMGVTVAQLRSVVSLFGPAAQSDAVRMRKDTFSGNLIVTTEGLSLCIMPDGMSWELTEGESAYAGGN